jgi:hypothetical protein
MNHNPFSTAAAFGLSWQSDTQLEYFSMQEVEPAVADVTLRAVHALRSRQPKSAINRGFVFADGVRFKWNDEVTFDMFDGNRIEYLMGPGWTGKLPLTFYSTVAALTVAWRGLLPFHASAVEIDGSAVLVSGSGGAGKSTLTAGLVDQGARFISDDLSVVGWSDAAGGYVVYPGRPTLRLYPTTASWISESEIVEGPQDERGKQLLRLHCQTEAKSIPLAFLIQIGAGTAPISGVVKYEILARQLFRPKWMAQLPHHAEQKRALAELSKLIRIVRHKPHDVREKSAFEQNALEALGRIRSTAI